MSRINFIDKVKIFLRAGKGGDGCLSFRREKFIPKGGPNGGNGGRGADIYLQANSNTTTLLEVSYNPHIRAENGSNGAGWNKTGLDGQDKIIFVPCGTVAKTIDSETKKEIILADLVYDGEKAIIAHGGNGGRGNLSFKTHKNTAPFISEKGDKGEELEVVLELKVLADVGLVGFPNAGKSTFLSTTSSARPKIADYPFTTLSPKIGMVLHKHKDFAIADIPGIIEGASEGKGLGHKFLKHIERTRVIVHLIDPLGFDNIPPMEGIVKVADELKNFDKKLASKPRIIAVNKSDLPEAEQVYKEVRKKYKNRKVFLISTATGDGVKKVLDEIIKLLAKNPLKIKKAPKPKTAVHKVAPAFRVSRTQDDQILVTGKQVEKMINVVHFEQQQGVERLKYKLKKIGLEKALLKEGVVEGDVIMVGDTEFAWHTSFIERPTKVRMTAKERLEKREERRKQTILKKEKQKEIDKKRHKA